MAKEKDTDFPLTTGSSRVLFLLLNIDFKRKRILQNHGISSTRNPALHSCLWCWHLPCSHRCILGGVSESADISPVGQDQSRLQPDTVHPEEPTALTAPCYLSIMLLRSLCHTWRVGALGILQSLNIHSESAGPHQKGKPELRKTLRHF